MAESSVHGGSRHVSFAAEDASATGPDSESASWNHSQSCQELRAQTADNVTSPEVASVVERASSSLLTRPGADSDVAPAPRNEFDSLTGSTAVADTKNVMPMSTAEAATVPIATGSPTEPPPPPAASSSGEDEATPDTTSVAAAPEHDVATETPPRPTSPQTVGDFSTTPSSPVVVPPDDGPAPDSASLVPDDDATPSAGGPTSAGPEPSALVTEGAWNPGPPRAAEDELAPLARSNASDSPPAPPREAGPAPPTADALARPLPLPSPAEGDNLSEQASPETHFLAASNGVAPPNAAEAPVVPTESADPVPTRGSLRPETTEQPVSSSLLAVTATNQLPPSPGQAPDDQESITSADPPQATAVTAITAAVPAVIPRQLRKGDIALLSATVASATAPSNEAIAEPRTTAANISAEPAAAAQRPALAPHIVGTGKPIQPANERQPSIAATTTGTGGPRSQVAGASGPPTMLSTASSAMAPTGTTGSTTSSGAASSKSASSGTTTGSTTMDKSGAGKDSATFRRITNFLSGEKLEKWLKNSPEIERLRVRSVKIAVRLQKMARGFKKFWRTLSGIRKRLSKKSKTS